MRYYFWFYINEIFLYPLIIGLVSPFYFVFDGKLWAVTALVLSLCVLSSLLTRYLGRSLITLTAAKSAVFAGNGELDKALNRLIYLSRFLPGVRHEVRHYYSKRQEVNKVDLMELAVKCMRSDNVSLKPFIVIRQVIYVLGLVLSVIAALMRLIG